MRSDRLRVVSGNAFATLVVVRAYAANGSELGGWSLGDSEDVSVTAVSRYGRRVMEHEIVADTALRVNCIRVEWPADMAVCEWGLEITGTHDGRVWRSMEPGVVTIVRTNPEACIPESSIIASDYYRVVQELLVVGSGGVQSDWAETNPDAGGYIKHKPDLAEVATSGAYSDLTGVPVIPTRVGQLTNDMGYVTSSTLSGYATKGEVTAVVTQVGVLSESVSGIEDNVESLEQQMEGKAEVSHTHPHTSITDWASATASFLTTATASATYLSKTDAAATYATIASVPTKTSDLTNDSGYITTASLSGYATHEWVQDAWDAYDQEYHMTTAYTTATAAASAAAAADTKATNAATAADTANTTANAASTTAHAAQTRADNAYTLADTANTTANAALPASTIWSGTQAQYDALTAAQKAAVIAFIEEEE